MLYTDNTAKLLGLEEVNVKKVWHEDNICHVDVEMPRRKHICPCCGSETDRIHDYRSQKVRDVSGYGSVTYLHFRKRRYVCNSCGKRFYEKNGFVPRYYRMTSRKIAAIISELRETVSASHVARKHHVSVSTVFRYFDVLSYKCTQLPEVLSIDEFKGDADGEKYQCITTDAANKRILDILPNRKKSDLKEYFMAQSSRKDVKYVVIDMNRYFKEVAEECFPNAKIVIDRYHVTRQAVWAMERVRKAEQKKLSGAWRRHCKNSRYLLFTPREKLDDEQREKLRTILGLSTRLEIAYDLKNDFLDLMKSPDSATAAKRLAEWLYRAENVDYREFDACVKAIHNWGEYILNAFDVPYTNGFTEGCNNKTKVLKRVCYGMTNFSRLKNRILHCAGARTQR